MTFRCTIFVLVLALGASACQGDERLSEKARLEGKALAEAELKAQLDSLEQLKVKAFAEGKAAAQAEIAEQNANLARRAEEMEADLERRQRFYQAVSGSYEGSMQTERGAFNIRVSLVPTVSPVQHDRTRTLEEITSDLTTLSFNVQVLQWNPTTPLSAVGCRMEGVRPDLINGLIRIASASCPNFYSLKVSDETSPYTKPEEVAAAVRDGRISTVPGLVGDVRPSTSASIYKFSAKKSPN